MPLHPLLTCGALISADGAVYRAVTCLAVTYWLSGCRPLPDNAQSLSALIRLPQGHMTRMKPAIDAALAELLPMLASEYRRYRETATMRKAIAIAANAESVRVRRAKAQRDANHLPSSPNSPRLQPATIPPRHDDGRTDMRAWRDADKRHKATASVARAHASGSGSGLLSDGTRRAGS
jgi:hypothetical protein